MPFDHPPPNRRDLLSAALALGVGQLAPRTRHNSTDAAAPASMRVPLAQMPDRIFVDHDGIGRLASTVRRAEQFTTATASVQLTVSQAGTAIAVTSPSGPIARVVLRWDRRFAEDALFLGDHWERGYGDLQWRYLHPDRVMPWYFAAHQASSGQSVLVGVKTQARAMCFWVVDGSGVSLWLDLRNGGSPSLPGDRVIEAATVVSMVTDRSTSPFVALQRFCRVMCPAPRLAPHPICGNNNWYYSYGKDFDADAMRRDAAYLATLADGHPNKPYCVIDAGWTPGSSAPGGPWTSGKPVEFPHMPGLAADMKKLGVRPGIWMRPTALTIVDNPTRLRAGPVDDDEKPLDLTRPENLQGIADDIARVRSWGYELIKHDFSCYDMFGRWGFQMGAELTDGGWHFADRTHTNAEIIGTLYRTLRAAAGDVILLGCNTVGHLGAGLFEIQRTGDDTSGRDWDRTRKMGVNTLAFRLAQHDTFFASDPDCAPHTSFTPWALDRQFLDLVARSGASLFISADPRRVTAEETATFRSAMHLALSGGARGGCEPLDWLHTTTPRRWRIGSETVEYSWEDTAGANPLRT